MTDYRPSQAVVFTADATLFAVWMAVPSAQTWKIWSGAQAERFTYADMTRIEGNIDALIAIASAVDPIQSRTWEAVTRASQFSYSEAQKVENALGELASALGVQATMATDWSAGRTVSWIDFERWESVGWAVYQAMGGASSRFSARGRKYLG